MAFRFGQRAFSVDRLHAREGQGLENRPDPFGAVILKKLREIRSEIRAPGPAQAGQGVASNAGSSTIGEAVTSDKERLTTQKIPLIS